MLLFQKRFHAALVAGTVTVTFRRWQKPHVRPGGRYRCHPIGVLEVDRVEVVRVADLTEADAQASGFETRADLVAYIRTASDEPLKPTSTLYRVELHYGGDGDRVEIALDANLSPEDVRAIADKLARFDASAPEPWTHATLAVIDAHPRTAASQLAKMLGRETAPFKEDVRKLKKLGLTQSFEVGYELSPRGRRFFSFGARTPR